ncbi:histone-like nucleoid-structuring protein Lsr2 [Streptomyces sp. NPDC020719]|uniref:Lsr2 family DNA-binding protein n=1 Tax=Streptomyces sp. NPDC020719 TaxID=3154896 RepID=UPI0033C7BE89
MDHQPSSDTSDQPPAQSPDRTDTSAVTIHQDPASQAIRRWARANGYLVNDRGRIPASIRQEYEQECAPPR